MNMRLHCGFALVLVFLSAQALDGPVPGSLSRIHEALQDWRMMARMDAFVFIGEIGTMHPVQTDRCRSGFEQKLEYIVRDLLWSDPDSYAHPGYLVGKDFIDCAQKQLAAPLKEGSKVIVLCGLRLSSYNCVPPTEATTANLNCVRRWTAELRSRQGDEVWLQIHERMLEDAELLRKSKVPGVFVLNGEHLHPLVFAGEVRWIQPAPVFAGVVRPKVMDVSVSKLLFGELADQQIRVRCRSDKCAGTTVGAKVVGYCRISRVQGGQDCFVSMTSSEKDVLKLKEWLLEARLVERK